MLLDLHPSPKIGLVLDLTNTTRYYSTQEWTKLGIKHLKVRHLMLVYFTKVHHNFSGCNNCKFGVCKAD
jgi:hypothetical protein